MHDGLSYGVTRRGFLRASGLSGAGMLLGPSILAAAGGLAASAVLAVPGALAEEPHPTKMPLNDLTDEDEVALGDILANEIEKDLAIVSNSLADNYLAGIVQKLAAVSQRPNMPYRCKLVNEKVINAFSIAGGHIYLYRGLVETIDKEDELVATLSHEIGHIVGRHSANKFILNMKAKQAYDLVKNNIPAHAKAIEEFIEKLGGGLAVLAMLQYSRANEFEADKLGFYETLRAGWDPAGFISLFDIFIALEKQSTGMPIPLLRDHPAAEDRSAALRKELTEVTVPKDARTDSISFHAFQLGMKLLPDPPKPPEPAPEPSPSSSPNPSSTKKSGRE